MTRTEILAEAILAASRHSKGVAAGRLTAFLGMRGGRYDRELMVVGRAVNGWREFATAQTLQPQTAREVARQAEKDTRDRPLEWIHENWSGADGWYRVGRSAFWRAVRRVQAELVKAAEAEDDWASRLAWSNLAKLSGTDGNPPEWLWNAQVDACREMLRSEIAEFAPKRILFATGWEWAKWFLDELASGATAVTGSRLCEAYGRLISELGSTPFVVAAHPQGKPEAGWAAEVLDGFRRAGEMDARPV